jgi:transcriptional regulator with XRE-family HTH domain
VRQGLTQAQLAERSGLALASVRAYEYGRRHPSQTALLSLVGALGIPREEANNVLMGAGYAVDWQGMLRQDFVPPRHEELEAQAAALIWPAFVTNQSFDVLYANRAAQTLFDVDLDREYTGFGERNILGGITHEEFASRVENWDEVVTFICGLAKGDSEWASTDLAHPAPYSRRPLERMLEGDPARITRFIDLWGSAPAIPNRLWQTFNLRLRYRGQVLSFSARMVLADIVTGMHWNECVPADGETWRALEGLAGC